MLILGRRAGETLKIGEEVTVTVLDIKGGQVRLGIDAPRGVQIRRGEIRHDNGREDADPSAGGDGTAGEPSREA